MKILFAVDGSEAASLAVKQVSRNLDAARDEIAFYFAPPEVHIRHASDAAVMRERARKAIADAVFGDVKSLLPTALAPKATMICADHTPTEGILLEADRWEADLIVVGARGLTQVDKWVLGSVADGVAQRSKRPVFVSRPRPEGRDDQPLRLLFAYDGSASCTAAPAPYIVRLPSEPTSNGSLVLPETTLTWSTVSPSFSAASRATPEMTAPVPISVAPV